jgi:hypothetical protein
MHEDFRIWPYVRIYIYIYIYIYISFVWQKKLIFSSNKTIKIGLRDVCQTYS